MTERPFDAEDLGVLIANLADGDGDTDEVFEGRLEAAVSRTEQAAIEGGMQPMLARRHAGIAREAARNRRRVLSSRGIH